MTSHVRSCVDKSIQGRCEQEAQEWRLFPEGKMLDLWPQWILPEKGKGGSGGSKFNNADLRRISFIGVGAVVATILRILTGLHGRRLRLNNFSLLTKSEYRTLRTLRLLAVQAGFPTAAAIICSYVASPAGSGALPQD
jgi:hypothetical protein